MTKIATLALCSVFTLMPLSSLVASEATSDPASQANEVKIESKEDFIKNYPFALPRYEQKPAVTVTQEQLDSEFSFRYGDWLQPGIPDEVGMTFFVKRIDARVFRIHLELYDPDQIAYDRMAKALVRLICLPRDIALKTGYDNFYWVRKHLPNKADGTENFEDYLLLSRKDDDPAELVKQYPQYTFYADMHFLALPYRSDDEACSSYKSHLLE